MEDECLVISAARENPRRLILGVDSTKPIEALRHVGSRPE